MLTGLFLFISGLALQAGDTLLAPATVTAVKGSQPLMKLASPVSTVNSYRMNSHGIWRPQSLSAEVPGLYIPDYGASLTSTIYFRGLGSRMENPVMGLYVDGIPVMDKNAYDFDWTFIRRASVLHGPQGTLYGRNSMAGLMVLESLSPSEGEERSAFAEYGGGGTFRAGGVLAAGNNAVGAVYRHRRGWWKNDFKGDWCDPYDGLSLRWKWEKPEGKVPGLRLGNVFSAAVSKEGGFAYGEYMDGSLGPVSYNDEGSYRRISAIEGFRIGYSGESVLLEGNASLQLLMDEMRMDQDFTPDPVFTLGQTQKSGTATVELSARNPDRKSAWQRTTGVFAFFSLNGTDAPVVFKRDGIRRLILDNANRNIPSSIGYLDITDEQIPITSRFDIRKGAAALFHESVYKAGKWSFTAGLRLDWETGAMDYDCLASMDYLFVPTMSAPKPLSVPFKGSLSRSDFEVIPKFSVMLEAAEGLFLYAGATKGFRAGGFNTQIFSDILQNLAMNALMNDLGVHLDTPPVSVGASNTMYKSEHAWNYEAGLRLLRGEWHVEASLFLMDIMNQQMTVFPPGMSTGRMMANAGKSRSKGGEISVSWKPGRFHAGGGWSFNDARFVEYSDGNDDFSGNHIPYAPVHTVSADAGYSWRAGKAEIALDAFLRAYGPIWWNEYNSLKEPFIVHPSVSLGVAFSGWEVYLRGDNLDGRPGKNFYFKSVGKEFFAREHPASITAGIIVKI